MPAPSGEDSAEKPTRSTNGSDQAAKAPDKEQNQDNHHHHHHHHNHHHDESADVLEEADEDMVIY